jgi:hypothetical protein
VFFLFPLYKRLFRGVAAFAQNDARFFKKERRFFKNEATFWQR